MGSEMCIRDRQRGRPLVLPTATDRPRTVNSAIPSDRREAGTSRMYDRIEQRELRNAEVRFAWLSAWVIAGPECARCRRAHGTPTRAICLEQLG